MMNRYICPNCKIEEYYFDGEILKCPKCNQEDFESALHESEGNIEYQELAKGKKPFFRLEKGRIYNCLVEYNGKVENTTVICIASSEELNKLFLVIEAEKCASENIDELKSKSFSEIWHSLIKLKLHNEYDCTIIVGATKKDNSIIEYNGWIFKNFEISI